MRSFLIPVATVAMCLWLVASCNSDANAAGRGCPSCVSGVEAPVVVSMPDQGTTHSILKGPVVVAHEPVRNVARVTAWGGRRVLRGTARVISAPFRWP